MTFTTDHSFGDGITCTIRRLVSGLGLGSSCFYISQTYYLLCSMSGFTVNVRPKLWCGSTSSVAWIIVVGVDLTSLDGTKALKYKWSRNRHPTTGVRQQDNRQNKTRQDKKLCAQIDSRLVDFFNGPDMQLFFGVLQGLLHVPERVRPNSR